MLHQLTAGLIKPRQRVHQPWSYLDPRLFKALSSQPLPLAELVALANKIELFQAQVGNLILQIAPGHYGRQRLALLAENTREQLAAANGFHLLIEAALQLANML